jgi:hypothetical protein
MKKVLFLISAMLVLTLSSCIKQEDFSILPKILITDITIQESSAIIECNATFDGGQEIIEKGICWSTDISTILLNKTKDDIGEGKYTSIISPLSKNTTYYIKAYATTNLGTGYSDIDTLNTTTATTTITTIVPVIPVNNSIQYLRFNSYYSADNGQVNVYEIQAFYRGENVALNKTGFASSYEMGSNWKNNGFMAVDNNSLSRWSSDRGIAKPDSINPVYIIVNLQNKYVIDSIQLNIKGFDNWKQTFDFSVSSDSIAWKVIDKKDNVTGVFKYYL